MPSSTKKKTPVPPVSKGIYKFNGKDVYDSEITLVVPLLTVDIKTAEKDRGDLNTPENFSDCVIAKACKRMFGETAQVKIKRTCATVDWEYSPHAKRFVLSDATRELLERFDRKEPLEPGMEIVLEAPKGSLTLANHRQTWSKWAKKNNYQGPTRPSKTGRKTDRKQRPSDPLALELRNGIYARAK